MQMQSSTVLINYSSIGGGEQCDLSRFAWACNVLLTQMALKQLLCTLAAALGVGDAVALED